MPNKHGFTFIEVMIATVIFVLAALAFMDLTKGSVRAVRDAKDVSTATWLLEQVMTDLETKVETEGLENGCEKKKEGKFEAPNERFTYTTYCTEVDLKLSEATAQLLQSQDKADAGNEPTKEDLLKKMILNAASEYISKATRELHAEVVWLQGKNRRKVDVTTHVTRYDQAFQLPNAGLTQ